MKISVKVDLSKAEIEVLEKKGIVGKLAIEQWGRSLLQAAILNYQGDGWVFGSTPEGDDD